MIDAIATTTDRIVDSFLHPDAVVTVMTMITEEVEGVATDAVRHLPTIDDAEVAAMIANRLNTAVDRAESAIPRQNLAEPLQSEVTALHHHKILMREKIQNRLNVVSPMAPLLTCDVHVKSLQLL